MATEESLDDIRRKALENYDFWDRTTKFLIGVAAVCELGLGIALIWFTDFSDPTQRLIFLAAATIYIPLALFIFALSYHAERNFERILQAIGLIDDSLKEDKDEGQTESGPIQSPVVGNE